MTEYTPCPTCHQYSHSIGEDDITAAFLHLQSMIDHRGDGMLTQSAFDEQTRDYAQILVAEITRLRADRNAVIRECAAVVENRVELYRQKAERFNASDADSLTEHERFISNAEATEWAGSAILGLIEGDE